MRRIVVIGATGFFGAALVSLLRERGHEVDAPPRAELDAEDGDAAATRLHRDDVVVDTAGPYRDRTTALLEAAIRVGADVVDIADSLDYALRVQALRSSIVGAGLRVFSSCSSVSAVTAAMVAATGIRLPERVSVCLVPSSAETASAATAQSLLDAVGQRVERLSDGALSPDLGWSESRHFWFPTGRGSVRGRLAESADAVNLPIAWPSLRHVDFWVDTNIPAGNTLLRAAAMVPGSARLLSATAPAGLRMARRVGRAASGLVVAVEGAGGARAVVALTAPRRGYLAAVLPAALVADALARGHGGPKGLVPAGRQLDTRGLLHELDAHGLALTTMPAKA